MRSSRQYWLAVVAFTAGCGPSAGDAHRDAEGIAPASGSLRVVSLAPHLAELVFAIGAGDLLVGVSSYTDFPKAAAALPRVGDAFALDQEQLAVLKPDLLLAWKTGTPAHVVDELRSRGYRVETIETRGVGDVAAALERIGALTGHLQQAAEVATAFQQGIGHLRERYLDAAPISVFYQVSSRPLYTINGEHYVSELIGICGGRNIFSGLSNLAPLVDVEAVLARDPEVMLASDDSAEDDFSIWHRWPGLAANRYGNYFFLPADEIGRATPRLLQAGETLCRALDEARANKERVRAAALTQ